MKKENEIGVQANTRPHFWGNWIQHLQVKDGRRLVRSILSFEAFQIRCDIDNSFTAFHNFPNAHGNKWVARKVKIQKPWNWQSRGTLPKRKERTTPFRRYLVNTCKSVDLVMKRPVLLKPTLFRQYSILFILLCPQFLLFNKR